LARGRRFRAASSARFLQEGHLRRKPGGSVRQRGATSGVTRRGLDSGAPRACFGANAAPRACPTSRQRGAPRALRSAGARAARRRAECQFASSRLPPALPPASSAASSSGVPPGGTVRRKRAEIAGGAASHPLTSHNLARWARFRPASSERFIQEGRLRRERAPARCCLRRYLEGPGLRAPRGAADAPPVRGGGAAQCSAWLGTALHAADMLFHAQAQGV
jgi:hypothetical protein